MIVHFKVQENNNTVANKTALRDTDATLMFQAIKNSSYLFAVYMYQSQNTIRSYLFRKTRIAHAGHCVVERFITHVHACFLHTARMQHLEGTA